MNNLRNKNKEGLRNGVLLSPIYRRLISGLALLLMIGFSSCNPTASFEGTYVNTAGSEFSIARDTLRVEHEQGQRYLLHRSTGFQLLDDAGKPGQLQYEQEEWTAVYDLQTELMTESRHGKQISFDTTQGMMMVGKRKYKRITTE